MSPFLGRWDLTLATANGPRPSWLEIQASGPRTLVGRFVGTAGSARPISKVDVTGETLSFSIPPQWERGDKDLHVEGKVDGDRLQYKSAPFVSSFDGKQIVSSLVWDRVR